MLLEDHDVMKQCCNQMAALGIAKFAFQRYWFSDEDTLEGVSALDEQSHEIEYTDSLRRKLAQVLAEMEESIEDRREYGLFELVVAEQRLVRLGRARPANYNPYDYYQENYHEDNGYVVGRDDEEIRRIYALLQAEGIVRVDLQMYWCWGNNYVDAIHCFLEDGREIALPEHLAERYLWVIVQEEKEPYGRFRLLVNEQNCIRVGSISPGDIGMRKGDPFRGGEEDDE